MNASKKTISFWGMMGMTVGGALPMAFGDFNTFDAWSVLGGLVGGLIAIWLGVWVAKHVG